jgi:hypothetical protein
MSSLIVPTLLSETKENRENMHTLSQGVIEVCERKDILYRSVGPAI